jgi:hypothetical protein
MASQQNGKNVPINNKRYRLIVQLRYAVVVIVGRNSSPLLQ